MADSITGAPSKQVKGEDMKMGDMPDSQNDVESVKAIGTDQQKAMEGHAHFHRLGWKRMTILLIVEAIALGSLSLPSAFATLGMVAGVLLTVGIGCIAIYTSYIVGQVKLKYDDIHHYADAGGKIFGRFGYELVGAMFSLQLIFLVGSHCLTGTIAFQTIVDQGICSIVWGVVSAIILLLLAIPPSFADLAFLGYIDFVSIVAAIGITIIATGIKASGSDGGLASVPWSAYPKEGCTLVDAIIAVTNICFAYSFSITQFSVMDEMSEPRDYVKSIWALGLIEIVIYTITGAVVYAFVGVDVGSPALRSAGPLISKVAFGVGLPVIYISGSINTTVVGRYIHGRMFANTVTQFINTPKGWATWLGLITVITIIAFIIAEAIPFFNDLLSLSSALFITGFTFYFPALFWFMLIREGPWYAKKNLIKSIINAIVFVIGIAILIGGTYAAIYDINSKFEDGTVKKAFSCGDVE